MKQEKEPMDKFVGHGNELHVNEAMMIKIVGAWFEKNVIGDPPQVESVSCCLSNTFIIRFKGGAVKP